MPRKWAPALDEVEETSGRLPEKLSLDNGYYSGEEPAGDVGSEGGSLQSRRTGERGEGGPGREQASLGEGGLSL